MAEPQHDPALSQWFTPTWLAERIAAEWGPWDGLRVLEPAAGDGALVAPLAARRATVHAYEIDERWAARIHGRVEAYGAGDREAASRVTVSVADFLAADIDDTYHRAVLNPPFERGGDLQFISRALQHSLEVIAIVRLAFLAGRGRRTSLWSRAHLAGLRVLSRRPRFSGSRGTARYDFAVVRIVRGRPGGACDVGWWSGGAGEEADRG